MGIEMKALDARINGFTGRTELVDPMAVTMIMELSRLDALARVDACYTVAHRSDLAMRVSGWDFESIWLEPVPVANAPYWAVGILAYAIEEAPDKGWFDCYWADSVALRYVREQAYKYARQLSADWETDEEEDAARWAREAALSRGCLHCGGARDIDYPWCSSDCRYYWLEGYDNSVGQTLRHCPSCNVTQPIYADTAECYECGTDVTAY